MSADLERELAHAQAMATAVHRPDCAKPNPGCPGCVTDNQRVLWRQLAAEYRAQLDRHRREEMLL